MEAAIQNTKQLRHRFKSSKKNIQGTPPTNQGWEEKEEGSTDKSSYSKPKMRVTQVSIIKEKHSRYTPPLIRCGRKKKSRVLMIAGVQNTK